MSDTQESIDGVSVALQVTSYEGDVQATISKRLDIHSQIKSGETVCFEPLVNRQAGGQIEFGITVDFNVDSDSSTTVVKSIRSIDSNDQHIIVFPRKVAELYNLHKRKDQGGEAVFAPVENSRRLNITFEPPVTVQEIQPESEFESVYKTLMTIDGSGDGRNRHRLKFPVDYTERYSFDKREALSITPLLIDGEIGFRLTPDGEEGVRVPLHKQTVTSETSQGNISETHLHYIHLPTTVINFLGVENTLVELTARNDDILLKFNVPVHHPISKALD